MKPPEILAAGNTRRLLLAVVMIITGCAQPSATNRTNAVPFKVAVTTATDDLVTQTQKMPAFFRGLETSLSNKVVIVDPMIDGVTGEQTVVSQQMEQLVIERIRANYAQFQILPFDYENLAKAQYVLSGMISREKKESGESTFQVSVAMIDIQSATVVAQAKTRSRDDNLDTTPTPFFRDSPVVTRDKVVDGYIRTASYSPGSAADPTYLKQMSLATILNDALEAYNQGRFEDALTLYQHAADRPDGQQLRVLSGVYLSQWQLGETADAEETFSKIVAIGLASNSLNIKFLFKPNTTDFPPDPKVSGAYPIWLRQVARQATNSNVCLTLVGHTSHTGSQQYNDRLSEQRANAIKGKLETESRALRGKMKAIGVGYRENIVGTGTDDLRDALDRRVEFRVVSCQEA